MGRSEGGEEPEKLFERFPLGGCDGYGKGVKCHQMIGNEERVQSVRLLANNDGDLASVEIMKAHSKRGAILDLHSEGYGYAKSSETAKSPARNCPGNYRKIQGAGNHL
ncbi:hypothetical protein ANCCEY_02403 [Ancylostoma ceylanicum]|uniref:Uncharacterized protein n=1 Tax=Ancylostoma ceylanicum TaxID=53326 RepID=A0A0D6M4N3_9BILA|nr:hypothetical protein ANCCEY_02403 [Ancylostoma ceylanicum]